MMKSLKFQGPVLIVIAAILWALDGVVRRSLFTLPPITIVFLEHLIGTALLLPLIAKEFLAQKFTSRIIGLAIAVSLLSSLLGTLWFTTALAKVNFISFSVVFLLQKLQPIFVILSATLLLKEKITPKYLQWAALAFVAAYFVTFKNGYVSFATGNQTVIAAGYALAAAAAWGIGTTLSKLLMREVSSNVATGLRFIGATIFGLLGVMVMGQSGSLSMVEPSQWARLVFIALSTGMVALWIYYRGLQKTEAKIATLLELVFPLLAVFIDAVIYKSFLAPSQYLAAVVLMFALYQIALLQKPEKVASQANES
ncbi:MAG TPA: DMT family transporter [Vitreimonas sp.]|nr:DMT family transporter [Vitreimonas sp.]